jgi:hypothetical protein
MTHKLPRRLPLLLIGGLAATAVAAAPAGATEGPVSPAPAPGLPNVLSPVTFPPLMPPAAALPPAPTTGAPLTVAPVKRRVSVRSARIVPKSVRRGRRPVLQMRLSGATRVKVVVKRGTRRVSTRTMKTGASRAALRLPALAPGRYHVSIVAGDGKGTTSRTYSRTFTVHR